MRERPVRIDIEAGASVPGRERMSKHQGSAQSGNGAETGGAAVPLCAEWSVQVMARQTRLRCSAVPENLSRIRRLAQSECQRAGLLEEAVHDMVLAVGEAASNAIEHGSPKGACDRIALQFRPTGGGLEVTVRDEGRGFDLAAAEPDITDPSHPRGRGLPFMRMLTDRFDVFPSPRGTLVRLFKQG